MIGLILKHWKLIVDILVIAVIVVLIFLWNPFNLFGKGLKLQDTANMVSEIKEIGELVTAEYYGEVIASDEEAELGLVEKDTIEILGERMYREIKREIFTRYELEMDILEQDVEKFKKERKRDKKFSKGARKIKSMILAELVDENEMKATLVGSDLYSEDLYHALILYLGRHEHNLDPNAKKFVRKDVNSQKNNGTNKFVRRKLTEILSAEYENIVRFDEGDIAFKGYLNQGFQSTFPYRDFFLEYMELRKAKVEGKREAKKQLALIGRGSVKAGFKFNELNDGNFVYDKGRQIIHFFGFQAEILNEDINPWFIPEKRVPGFQIIAEKNSDFYQLKQVKEHCIDKLVNNAKKAGIVAQAQKNGEEALKEFFSLLTGDEIKTVIFHQDQLIYESQEILKDSLIDFDEISLIDSLVAKNISAIEKEKNSALKERREVLLSRFISNLSKQNIKVRINKKTYEYPFNYYTRYLPDLLKDSIVSKEEIDWVATSLRHKLVGDEGATYLQPPASYKYWFTDSLEYLNAFNGFIDKLIQTEAKKGFFEQVADKSLDMALPKDEEKWEAFAYERDELIKDSKGKLTYQFIGDTLRYFQLDTIDAPHYLKYFINEKVDFNDSIIIVDTAHHVFSKGANSEIKRYTLIHSDGTNSSAIDEILFELADEDVINLSLSDKEIRSRNLGRYQQVDFFDTDIIRQISDEKADTIVDTTFYAAELRYISLAPSADSKFIKKIEVNGLEQYETHKFTKKTDKGDTKRTFNWRNSTFAIGGTILRDISKQEIGEVIELKVNSLIDGIYYLSKSGSMTTFGEAEFYAIKKNANTYTWEVKSYDRDTIALNLDTLKNHLNGYISFEIVQKLGEQGEIKVYHHNPNNNWTSIRSREMVALRDYILKANRKYNDVSTIIRARRKLDRYIEDNTKFSSLDSLRENMNRWIDENITQNIKQ